MPPSPAPAGTRAPTRRPDLTRNWKGNHRWRGISRPSPSSPTKLEWMDSFVSEEVEPLDLVWGDKTFHPLDDTLRKVVDPLKQQVRDQGLWACHLGPELGGTGYGQVKLAL